MGGASIKAGGIIPIIIIAKVWGTGKVKYIVYTDVTKSILNTFTQ